MTDHLNGKLAVRVDYRKDGNGWRYDFFGVETNIWYGGGWSAGLKRDAKQDAERRAAVKEMVLR